MQRIRAFTQVDLLTVLVLMVVVLALQAPALGSARDSARRVHCLSNQRQFAVTSITFATDDRKTRLIPAWSNNKQVAVQHTLYRIADERPPADAFMPGVEMLNDYGLPNELLQDPSREFKPIAKGNAFTHAYQYFGGIKQWHNLPGKPSTIAGLSPVTLDDLTGDMALVADHTVRQSAKLAWGKGDDPAFKGSPPHGIKAGQPIGGNHVFGDGSGTWVRFDAMLQLHSWDPTHQAFYFQEELGDYKPPQ